MLSTLKNKILPLTLLCGALSLLSWSLCAAKKEPGQNAWDKDWGPLVPHKTFPKDCSICHLPKRWDVLRKDFSFDHAKETGYPLVGAHARAACLRCHNDRGPVSAYVSRGCAGCHVDPHKSTLGTDCKRCHLQDSWRAEGQAVRHAGTRFPLTGVHRAVSCEQCHTRASAGEFKGLSTECSVCHKKEYERAPNHVAMAFPQKCDQCHKTNTWTQGSFNHSLVAGGSGSCVSCHRTEFQSAPNHVSMAFPQTCQDCHNTTSWKGTRFNHDAVPGHADSCSLCHRSDFQRAPNHAALSFSQACKNCHNTRSWAGAAFDHSTLPGGGSGNCAACHQSDFQRAPDHVSRSYPQSCQSCHSTARWQGASFNHSALPGGGAGSCVTCHQSNFQSAPNHVSVGFSQTCNSCHNTSAWKPASFTHKFPLTGNHNVSCATCHLGGTPQNFTCLSCHAHSQALMDPKHKEVNGYSYNSQACNTCHWNGKKP